MKTEKNKLHFTFGDVHGFIGWDTTRQRQLCKIAKITPVIGIKEGNGKREKLQNGYDKEMFLKLLEAGGYTMVWSEDEEMLVLRKHLRKKLEGMD